MMLAKHYLYSRTGDHDLHEALDAYYTRFLSGDERREPSYRHIWVVERAPRNGWWEAATAALEPTVVTTPATGSAWPEIAGWLIQLVGLRRDDQAQQLATEVAAQLGQLSQASAAQSRHLAHLQHVLAQRDAQIADLEQRARWLDEQARAARRELEATQNGLVMRLLRRMGR
jgi:hypothetical protein